MKFVVNYEAEIGHKETFGFFETAFDAMNWAKADAELNIQNAKDNGINYKIESMRGGMLIHIPDFGTWTVATVVPVAK